MMLRSLQPRDTTRVLDRLGFRYEGWVIRDGVELSSLENADAA
jgi:hypothetical protein